MNPSSVGGQGAMKPVAMGAKIANIFGVGGENAFKLTNTANTTTVTTGISGINNDDDIDDDDDNVFQHTAFGDWPKVVKHSNDTQIVCEEVLEMVISNLRSNTVAVKMNVNAIRVNVLCVHLNGVDCKPESQWYEQIKPAIQEKNNDAIIQIADKIGQHLSVQKGSPMFIKWAFAFFGLVMNLVSINQQGQVDFINFSMLLRCCIKDVNVVQFGCLLLCLLCCGFSG